MFSEEHTSKFHVRKTLIKRISFTFHAYRNLIFISFFFFLAIFFLLITYIDNPVTRRVRAVLFDISAPVMKVALIPYELVENLKNNLRDWGLTYNRIQVLEHKNQRLEATIPLLSSLQRENEELKKLLHVKEGHYKSFVTAQVITYPSTPFAKSILVTSGTKDGVVSQQPVMTEAGLVGRTIEVGHFSSRVLLITDINSKVPVVVKSSEEHAILVGDNTDMPILKYFPKTTRIKPGDLVETSGIGGTFPAGIPVGKVMEVKEEEIVIQPLASISTLNFVTIFSPFIDAQLLKTS